MGIISRFRRRKDAYAALTDEERISRYVYLLNTLPASIIESAHAAAFKDLPVEKRREMLEELRGFIAEDERETESDDPKFLAKLMRRAEARRVQRAGGQDEEADRRVLTDVGHPLDAIDPRNILMKTGVLPLVAMNVVMSQSVASYYLVGAGALTAGYEPAWIGGLIDPGSAGVGRGGGDGGWGGGFDGGFDGGGGGWGGGFDGGGGGGDGGGGG